MGRAFGFLGVVITMAIGLYIYSVQIRSVSATGGGGVPTGAAEIMGVKSDLMSFATAERGYFAAQGNYASLDELTAGKYVTIGRDRPPYTYDADVTPTGFRVTATRDTKGGPAELWIDETMQIKSSD
jgi:pseudouridine-5'-phosphate glycosidase